MIFGEIWLNPCKLLIEENLQSEGSKGKTQSRARGLTPILTRPLLRQNLQISAQDRGNLQNPVDFAARLPHYLECHSNSDHAFNQSQRASDITHSQWSLVAFLLLQLLRVNDATEEAYPFTIYRSITPSQSLQSEFT